MLSVIVGPGAEFAGDLKYIQVRRHRIPDMPLEAKMIDYVKHWPGISLKLQ